MNILVTGSEGFVGRNLVENLKNLRDGKNRTRPGLHIEKIYEYDRRNTADDLDEFCSDCDFVFNLAGVNRPEDPKEFKEGNYGFASMLLDKLKKHENKCPVMLSSSLQATLSGRFGSSEYGLSKLEGENLFFEYSKDTGAVVYVYRFPNLAGKWVRPNYNSAIGTFCSNIANDLPIVVNDPTVELEVLFIDDLIEEMFDALEGHPHRAEYPKTGEIVDGVEYDGLTPRADKDGFFCYSPITHKVTLGYIVETLQTFHEQPSTLLMPSIVPGSFEYKLFSMYLSYLPESKTCIDLSGANDNRGSFTEVWKSIDHGQFSVNVSLPGATKGEHWHNSKWEIFIVVFGHGVIQERNLLTNEIREFEVSGDKLQAVYCLPGWTHNIINLSKTDNMITLMWANEIFDPNKPDTYRELVNGITPTNE